MVELEFRLKSTEFHTPTLKCFENGGEISTEEVIEFNKNYFNLSDEELNIKTDKNEPKYINYTRNALYDLNHSPFLESGNGKYKITERGLAFLRNNPYKDVFKVLKNYLTYRHYKRMNTLFESEYHILSIDLFVSSKFSTIEKGNEILFEYLFEDDVNLAIIKQDNIILGYDKHDCCFKYLFKILDVSDNYIRMKKILEISEGFEINDSFLIELLDKENLCSVYYEEFEYYYKNMYNAIPLFGESAVNLEDYDNFKRNKIYFGAPGTGKSFKLNDEKNELLKGFEDNYERVTFHPDYSYSSFVGSYKPVKDYDNGKKIISYDYVAGPFMRVLSKALKYDSQPFLLIIEEINRANVASVFGDVFQLLDRDKKHNSEYPVNTSKEMREYLAKVTGEDVDKYKKIRIPSNMFIWATMNSADQGVFFMDAAFKRRWDFKHIDIDEDESEIYNDVFEFPNSDEYINWNILRKSINKFLLDRIEVKEDKLLGPFFISEIVKFESDIPNDDFEDSFKNKVLMYLYEDAAKSKPYLLFEGSNEKTYSKICNDFDEKGIGIFHKDILIEYNSIKEKHNPNEKVKDKNDDSSSN